MVFSIATCNFGMPLSNQREQTICLAKQVYKSVTINIPSFFQSPDNPGIKAVVTGSICNIRDARQHFPIEIDARRLHS
jgi:hypothetical protein